MIKRQFTVSPDSFCQVVLKAISNSLIVWVFLSVSQREPFYITLITGRLIHVRNRLVGIAKFCTKNSSFLAPGVI